MNKISIITTSRSDYGILKNIIKNVFNDKDLILQLIVSGSHLCHEYGYTVKIIEDDGFPIVEKVDIQLCNNNALGLSKTMGVALIDFASVFNRLKPDFVIVLGDRYELIPIVSCAMMFKIPIAHISGGEVTEGAIDDAIRHSISKMSYLHFPANEIYRKRLIQLGENPRRVFNYGDVGVEMVNKVKFYTREETYNFLNIKPNQKYAIVVLHPTTLDADLSMFHVEQLIKTLENNNDFHYVIIKSNADSDSQEIINRLEKFYISNDNCRYYSSLSIERYLSCLKYSKMIIGNSSSGIVEAPSLSIPTINIGNRQKGRLLSNTIFNCDFDFVEISKKIRYIDDFFDIESMKKVYNPYEYKENTSELIVQKIKEYIMKGEINLKKKFFDIDYKL